MRPDFAKDRGSFPNWILIGVEEGTYRYELPGQRGLAGFGDIVLCPPDTMLGRWALDHLTMHVVYFDWHEAGGEMISPGPVELGGKHSVTDLVRLSSNYHFLQHLEQPGDERAQALQAHILADLIVLCLSGATNSDEKLNIQDDLMARAAHYLETHQGETITLKTLAASLHLSPVQFTRRFRQALGATPNEFLTSLRLQKARSLLTETDLAIHEIARLCGYKSGLYLSRLFLKEMQIRPGKFRRQYKL